MTALLHEALSSSSLRRNISVLSLSLLMVAGALFAAPSALAQQQPSTSETVGAEGRQTIIHITKDGTNSYLISEGSSSIGTFDTTYRIAGERSALMASEQLIITTITEDFMRSPTVGYVTAGATATNTGGTAQDTTTGPTLPNPFATSEQITERITSELRTVIGSAENIITSQDQLVEIKCDFGMALDDMRCFHAPSVRETGGTTSSTSPSNNTGGGGNNTDPLTVQAQIADIDQDATSLVLFETLIDGGTSPYTCEWDLGDNKTTSDRCNVSHIYENVGTYTATVTVTDSVGQTASDSTGQFTITNTTGGGGNNTDPLTVQAQIADIDQDATSLVLFETLIDGGTSPYTCEWDLGDGTASDECGPNHIYENVGTYTATVTVTDSVGQTASDSTGQFTITNTTGGGETETPSPGTNATAGGETETPSPGTNATAGGETETPPETPAAPSPTTGEGGEGITTPLSPPGATAPETQDMPASDPNADRPELPPTGEGGETTADPT